MNNILKSVILYNSDTEYIEVDLHSNISKTIKQIKKQLQLNRKNMIKGRNNCFFYLNYIFNAFLEIGPEKLKNYLDYICISLFNYTNKHTKMYLVFESNINTVEKVELMQLLFMEKMNTKQTNPKLCKIKLFSNAYMDISYDETNEIICIHIRYK